MRLLLLTYLILTGWAWAEPHVVRLSLPITPATTAQKPSRVALNGKLFQGRVETYVVNTNTVEVRVYLKNLVGPAAYFAVHAGLVDNQGRLLAGSGYNDCYHEKKRGHEGIQQFQFIIPRAQLKSMDFVTVAFYEDSTYLGRR